MNKNFILLVLMALLGCGSQNPDIQHIQGFTQGTTYTISYWSDQATDNNDLQLRITAELEHIDLLMSNYRDDSVISQFNQNTEASTPTELDTEIIEVLKHAQQIHQDSLGCYDPTIFPLFELWGFKSADFEIPKQEQIDQALKHVGFEHIIVEGKTVSKPHGSSHIDLSSIGQGHTVAKLSALMKAQGINNHLVEIGGEMLVAGQKPEGQPWRVGVERPVPNSQQVSEIIEVTGTKDTAIMTSGTYRHYYDQDGKQYSHILNPNTGKPVDHNTVAVTVLMDNATHADAWSTALLCLGADKGITIANQQGIAALFYFFENEELQRQPSQQAKSENEAWRLIETP